MKKQNTRLAEKREMRVIKCTHCGVLHRSQHLSTDIPYHHKNCSDAGHYNTMEEIEHE